MPAARSASSDSDDDGSISPAGAFAPSRLVRARLNTRPAATAAMAISPTPNVRIGTSRSCFVSFRRTGGRDRDSASSVPIGRSCQESKLPIVQVLQSYDVTRTGPYETERDGARS